MVWPFDHPMERAGAIEVNKLLLFSFALILCSFSVQIKIIKPLSSIDSKRVPLLIDHVNRVFVVPSFLSSSEV